MGGLADFVCSILSLCGLTIYPLIYLEIENQQTQWRAGQLTWLMGKLSSRVFIHAGAYNYSFNRTHLPMKMFCVTYLQFKNQWMVEMVDFMLCEFYLNKK